MDIAGGWNYGVRRIGNLVRRRVVMPDGARVRRGGSAPIDVDGNKELDIVDGHLGVLGATPWRDLEMAKARRRSGLDRVADARRLPKPLVDVGLWSSEG